MRAVLARAEGKGMLAARTAAAFIEDLEALDIRVDERSAHRALNDVHRLAIQYRLTCYNPACLELALRKAAPLATLDEELLAACKGGCVPVP